MRAHAPAKVVKVFPRQCKGIKEAPAWSVVIITVILVLEVPFLIAVGTPTWAEIPCADTHLTSSGDEPKQRQDTAGPGDNSSPKQKDRAENKSLNSKGKDKKHVTPSKIPSVIGTNRTVDESNYRKATRIERDAARNMRSIDNAIRQMNTDINRMRTLERRF